MFDKMVAVVIGTTLLFISSLLVIAIITPLMIYFGEFSLHFTKWFVPQLGFERQINYYIEPIVIITVLVGQICFSGMIVVLVRIFVKHTFSKWRSRHDG